MEDWLQHGRVDLQLAGEAQDAEVVGARAERLEADALRALRVPAYVRAAVPAQIPRRLALRRLDHAQRWRVIHPRVPTVNPRAESIFARETIS